MKNSTIRILVIIGTLTIVSLASIQFYLLKSAFSNSQKVFEHSVQVALFKVVSRLNNSEINQLPQISPIIKESSGYYVVDVNRDFDCETLEFLLISEFQRSNINFDFEYAIYDCYSDVMIYGNYVTFEENRYKSVPPLEFAKNKDLVYYFAVHFPTIKTDLFGSLRLWFIFAIIILCVLTFIIYAIWIILGQKRYSELQHSFVSTMTHEFRTPLSASNVAIEYLQKSKIIDKDNRLKKYIELIHLQNSRLNNLIERLLHMAASENRSIELDYNKFNIIELCNDVISVHESKNTDTKISFKYPYKKIEICSDLFHAGNIFHALIDNAIKYSKPSPIITISCQKQEKYISLSISDNGKGIPKKYRKKIFKQFYRIPTGNIHDVKGFGIGLYYVKLITKRMKWKISIDDKTGPGTRIVIKIPMQTKPCQ